LHTSICDIQWNPDFSNLKGKWKLVSKIGEFEKSGGGGGGGFKVFAGGGGSEFFFKF